MPRLGGLVVRFWLREWRVPSWEPDSTKDPPLIKAMCTLYLMSWVRRSPALVVRILGGEV
ncbi:hypothetical protein AVEN_2870-1, partial [Araneus ventricosus]